MATGWELLGNALAGPEPQDTLRTAKTELALIQAAQARDQMNTQRGLVGVDPTALTPEQQMAMIQAGYGSDYSNVMHGRNYGQEYDFKSKIADPATPMVDRQYAAQAVSGKPTNFLDTVGQAGYTDIRNPDAGVVQTPLAEALVGATKALEQQRTAQAERTAASPQTTPPMSIAEFAKRDELKRLQGVLNNYDPAAGITPEIKAQARARRAELLAGDDVPYDPQPVPVPQPEQPEQSLLGQIFGSMFGGAEDDAPAEVAAPAAQDMPVEVAAPKSKEEFDALPSGAEFIAPDGTRRIKP